MVLEVIQGEGVQRNRKYVVGRTRLPLASPMVQPQMEGEAAFASIQEEVERKQEPKVVRYAWISRETWRLVDSRAALQLAGRASTGVVGKAWRNFQCSLQEDSQQRVQAAGSNIEVFLAAGRVKEAWDQLAHWYCNARGKQSHPTS